jgi:Tol biopolymer transport system component
MFTRLRMVLLVGVLLVLVLIAGFLWGTPRLLEVFPAENSQNVSATAEVRVSFTSPMQLSGIEQWLTFEPDTIGSFSWQGSTLIFTPDRPWPAGKTVQVTVRPGIKASVFPSLALRQGKTWSFRIRLSGVVYLSPSQSPSNLFLVNPVSGEDIKLTDYSEGVLDFTISADGKTLYLSRPDQTGGSVIDRFDLSSGQAMISPTLDATNTNTLSAGTRVLDCPQAICQGLAVDPLGNYLAYERTALPGSDSPQVPQVWIVPLMDGKAGAPVLVGNPTHQAIEPTWSNKGQLAYYDKTDQAYHFIEPDGSDKARFPNQTGEMGVWRPDGKAFLAPEINYLSVNLSPELSSLKSFADSHLILFHLQTEASEDLTSSEGIEDATPAYSPDGQLLAFSRKYLDAVHWTPGRQLWIAEAESRSARQLTDSQLYNHFDFAWSPSGDQLAFVRKNQSSYIEPPEIWIYDMIANQATRLIQGGYQPLWVP